MDHLKLSKIVNYSLIISVFIVPILIFVVPFIMTLGIRYIPDGFQPSNDNRVKIDRDNSLVQEYAPQQNGLNVIGISINNFNLQTKNDFVMKLIQDEEVIQTITVSGNVIGDGDLVKFVFTPILNSKNQHYQIKLEAPDVDTQKSFEVLLTRETPLGEGNLYVNNKLKNEKLSLITYYKPQSRIGLIKDISGNVLSKFKQDLGFTVFYLGSLVLFSIYAFIKK